MLLFPLSVPGTKTVLGRDELIEVYLQIRSKLERVIAHRTGSLSLAADLTQEMFFKIDTIRAVIPTREEAEYYFIRAAVNASIDYLKIEARRRDLLQQAGETDTSASEPSAERKALARDELRRVEAALAELPEKCRNVFLMGRVHGLPQQQIATELGISLNLVEKYMVRALLHCRNRLAD